MTTSKTLVEKEDERVRFLEKATKLNNANTGKYTTQFLKKCAMIN
jgi:hypothetical protein